MANRNDSDARQHETLPGPGPGKHAPSNAGSGGGRPVEQLMDAAIERIARERDGGARERDGSFELARRPAGHSTAAQLVRRGLEETSGRTPTRLRWKGLDVSEEFREYADRVARGEELPPFEGRVLAEPNPAFPWGDAAQPEQQPKKRGSHPVMWGAAIVVLGLLGWSVVVKVQSDERNAALASSVAPLAVLPAPSTTASMPELPPSTSPHDVVETPTVTAEAPTVAPESATAEGAPGAPLTPPASSDVAPLPPAPAPSVSVASVGTVPTPSAPPAPPAATTPSVAVNLARPGALQQAVGAALAARSAPATKAPLDDEFGIMAPVPSTPVAPAPSPAPSAPAPAPVGAKSNASVGDLSRAGQPSAPGVRKEPGGESSAKGSLLVESPSF